MILTVSYGVYFMKVVLLRPIRTLTSTDTSANIGRYERSHRPIRDDFINENNNYDFD